MSNGVENNIPEAFRQLEKELTRWTAEGADELKKQIIAQGDLPKTGKTARGSHQASAPGESWANQSGQLGESFTKDEALLKTTLGSMLERAKIETGTPQIAARPTIEKAIDAARPMLEKLLQEACDRAARSSQI